MKYRIDGTLIKDDFEVGDKIFAKLCNYLDQKEMEYTIHDAEEGLNVLTASLKGNDLPMDIILAVNACDNLFIFTSLLPVEFGKEKLREAAMAICMINKYLNNGHFDLNVDTGEISFKMCNRWADSNVDDDIFSYFIQMGCGAVDLFNDKLLLLSKGMISLEDLHQFIHK